MSLLTLLAVARTGRYVTAADLLDINHTTASRRIAALERALGGRLLSRGTRGWEPTDLGRTALAAAEQIETTINGLRTESTDALQGTVRIAATEGFSAKIIAPVAARIGADNPRLSIDLITVTRRAPASYSGVDIEIVVGKPTTYRVESKPLGSYRLGLYGSVDYLKTAGTPRSRDDLAAHPLVYFIESMLTVDDLDQARAQLPPMAHRLSCTNVLIHVEATRAGVGIGLLPCYLAQDHSDLVRVLADEVFLDLDYWMVVRPEAARRREVAVIANALRLQVQAAASQLNGAIPQADAAPD
ncbi:LysR family transcriptional regulator [Tsukamurella tyrosinosolvens]|nr:LysR family transcriptional regulator [Tsukamurella tyrosinosolvens]AUN41862.1 LysR family transcriptional regulator [Tsukamurella tyrosinosolvens]